MKSAANKLNRSGDLLAFITGLALAFIIVTAGGCTSTVTPPTPKASQPSFDGTNADSGVIAFVTTAHGEVIGQIVRPHWRERYNDLIPTYGKLFHPPLALDAGLTPYTNGTWFVEAEASVHMTVMNTAKKKGLFKPP